MKLWQRIRAGVFCCALLSGFAPAAFAQAKPSPLDSILAEIELSYDSAMWVVQLGREEPGLADIIHRQRVILDSLTNLEGATTDVSEQEKRSERRWNSLRRLLRLNLDSLAARVRSSAITSAHLNPLLHSAEAVARDTSTPLVSSITARVLRQLDPVLGTAAAQAQSQARFAAVSQLFAAFQLYRERLLALADEACLERERLCLIVDLRRNRPYGGFTISGYSGNLYGVGGFVSISWFTGVQGRVVKARRAVIGFQGLVQLPEFREGAFEISGGSVFGDFAVMPGLIVSPGRDRLLELSGSVLYIPRSRLSLGVGYAVNHGLGVRAVYGIRPRSVQPAQQSSGVR